jgi:tripartite-type tricarboxylate transporter receptor subunit TctC
VGSIGVFSINAALFKDLRYQPRDFAPIALAVTTPNVLVTRPDLAPASMKELVEFAKKNPGRLSYCSSGTGSSDHLTGELLRQSAYIRAGRMKALAVTAKSRNAQVPNVPTTAEAGFAELVVTSWQAVAAPAKTPREVVAKLNDAAVRALRSPDIRERMNQIGFDVVASTPEEFGKFMQEEVDRWTKVVQRGGIKAE